MLGIRCIGQRLDLLCLVLHAFELAVSRLIIQCLCPCVSSSFVGQLIFLLIQMAATRFCIVFCFYRHSSKTMRQAPGCFQLPLFQEILIVLRESWIGAMLLYSVLHPLSSFLTPRFEGLHKKPSTVKYPILFIHGYACNAGYWYPVLRYLSNADVTQLYAINLQPLYLDIPAYAEQVAKKVEMILKETGSEKVILVGHSMGGLVARAFMKWHDGDKVAKLITLQTPHQGTDICTNPLARTFSGDSVSDMLPGHFLSFPFH